MYFEYMFSYPARDIKVCILHLDWFANYWCRCISDALPQISAQYIRYGITNEWYSCNNTFLFRTFLAFSRLDYGSNLWSLHLLTD